MSHYQIGDRAELSKTVSETDVNIFAELTGDKKPLHIDESIAKGSVFGERIAHGILGVGVISAVIGMQPPGPGTIYMEQDSKFHLAVKLRDTITAVVEVAEVVNETKNILKLNTNVYNQKGKCVIFGYTVVKAPAETV